MIVHRPFTMPSKHKQIFPGISNIVMVRKKSNWTLMAQSKLGLYPLLWNIWWWILCVRADLVPHNYHYLIPLPQEHPSKKSFVAPSLLHSVLSRQPPKSLIFSYHSTS